SRTRTRTAGGTGRVAPDAAAAAPPRELPPARRYRARVRPGHHRNHRAERLRQDDHPRGHRLGAVRRAGRARRQGLDPPARREGRNAAAAEVRGLEAGLPDVAVLAAARRAAEQRLSGARAAAKAADAARRAAEDALGREEPRWNEWMARRERTLSLDGERRMA